MAGVTTEHVTGTHDFVVANFSQLDGHIGVGGHVSSARFTVGGYDWTLKLYPDGDTGGDRESTSVFLHIMDEASRPVGDVIASYTLRLVERDGSESTVGRRDMPTQIYGASPLNNGHGFTSYFRKQLLPSTQCINDGCLTIRCVLTVVTLLIIVDPPLELAGHLERALKDGIGTDVTFQVGCRVFSAHKSMLAARSPVFQALLFGPMMEKDMQRIEVVDIRPVIFEMLLHFIYTDSLPGDGEAYNVAAMQDLLDAADFYGLDKLKLMCEENLCKIFDVKTVTRMLTFADQHGCDRLKDVCAEISAR